MFYILLRIGYTNIVSADPPPTPPRRGVGTVKVIKNMLFLRRKDSKTLTFPLGKSFAIPLLGGDKGVGHFA